MLILNAQKKWVLWEPAGIRLLLSPLSVGLRAELAERATEKAAGKGARPRFDVGRYNGLVGEHCIHDWAGVMAQNGETAQFAAECTAANKAAFMQIDAAAEFVFENVTGLALHMASEVAAAGNGCGG